jgi:hypothetical protein
MDMKDVVKTKVKNTNINVNFDLWLEALPELKKRKLSFSEFVNLMLADFLKKTKKQNNEQKEKQNGESCYASEQSQGDGSDNNG